MEKSAPTIGDLFPGYTEEQLVEAEDALDRYLTFVWRIFERLESEWRLRELEQLQEG